MRASPSRPTPPRPTVRFDLPIEIRNAIARIEILGEGSAGAVTLLDERGKRRRVGLVFGGTTDQAQPLLAPTYYIARALAPYAEIREGRGGVADAVIQLLDEQVSVLVLADVGALDRETLAKVDGVRRDAAACSCASPARGSPPATTTSCRCACAAAAATSAARCPGTRRKTFAPFTRESPFFGLAVPAEIGIRRQILAEPDGDLASQDLGVARSTARRS